MDKVDDFEGDLVHLDELELADDDKSLLVEIASKFGTNTRYLIISRGLSSAVKIVLKPSLLFPLLVKIDDSAKIIEEFEGDKLLRFRVPPLSIPPFDGIYRREMRSAISYRYITGGRVRHLSRRLDTEFHLLSVYDILRIVDDIFDVILKKCHWLDGNYEMKPISLPTMPTTPLLDADPKWQELMSTYTLAKDRLRQTRAPYGITHGDLHAKNVVITRDNAPVLIDFAKASKDRCQYHDFAKFETTLQFQVNGSDAEKLWGVEELFYGSTPLIIPHTNTKLGTCISRIRSNLWQGCTRRSLQMSNEEIEIGYAGYLLFHLIRLYSKDNNSMDTRNRCYHQAMRIGKRFAS